MCKMLFIAALVLTYFCYPSFADPNISKEIESLDDLTVTFHPRMFNGTEKDTVLVEEGCIIDIISQQKEVNYRLFNMVYKLNISNMDIKILDNGTDHLVVDFSDNNRSHPVFLYVNGDRKSSKVHSAFLSIKKSSSSKAKILIDKILKECSDVL